MGEMQPTKNKPRKSPVAGVFADHLYGYQMDSWERHAERLDRAGVTDEYQNAFKAGWDAALREICGK